MSNTRPSPTAQSSMSEAETQSTVSVVIPTFNNAQLLAECLTSVKNLEYPKERVEVIVADNASTNDTAGMLHTRFPSVKHVNLGKNTGFAAACNRGASEASGEYVAFLNDDAIAPPEWLSALFSALKAGGDSTCGCA